MKRGGVIVAAAAVFWGGCFVQKIPDQPGNPDWGLEVTWHGHSCFSIRDSVGRTIAIDPFDETVGYGRLYLRADAVIVTHDHFDHNHVRSVRARIKDLELVNSTPTIQVAHGLEVSGHEVPHDDEDGALHGNVRIYSFIMGGMRVVHLSDLGTPEISAEAKAFIGRPDILFIPVGGFTTLNAAEAKELVDRIKPGAVIPMHYGDIRFYKLDPLNLFTDLFDEDAVVHTRENHARIKRSDLKDNPVVYTFIPTRND